MSAFPSAPKPLTCRISSLTQNRVSVAQNMRRIVTSRGGQRWAFSLTYPKGMNRADVSTLWAFVVAQGGRLGSFDFSAPFQQAQGSVAGTPVVDGADQTGNIIQLKGFTADQSGVLKAGDYIRIEGSYKAYLVVNDVASGADGTAAVTVFPSLQSTPADEAAVSGDAVFRCALSSDQQDLSIDDILHYGLSLDLIEVLD